MTVDPYVRTTPSPETLPKPKEENGRPQAHHATFVTLSLIPIRQDLGEPADLLLDQLADMVADVLVADIQRHPVLLPGS
jgi:hypothetical protein